MGRVPVGELEILGPSERRWLEARSWGGAAEEVEGCIADWFEEVAGREPDRIALVDGDEQWSYGALNRRANRIAHTLQKRGRGGGRSRGLADGAVGGTDDRAAGDPEVWGSVYPD